MLHTLIGEGPKLCMQKPWFPLEPGSSFGVGNLVSLVVALLVDVLTTVEVICDSNSYVFCRRNIL